MHLVSLRVESGESAPHSHCRDSDRGRRRTRGRRLPHPVATGGRRDAAGTGGAGPQWSGAAPAPGAASRTTYANRSQQGGDARSRGEGRRRRPKRQAAGVARRTGSMPPTAGGAAPAGGDEIAGDDDPDADSPADIQYADTLGAPQRPTSTGRAPRSTIGCRRPAGDRGGESGRDPGYILGVLIESRPATTEGEAASDASVRIPLLAGVRTRVLVSFLALLVLSTAASVLVLRQVLISRISDQVTTELTRDLEPLQDLAAGQPGSGRPWPNVAALLNNFLDRNSPPSTASTRPVSRVAPARYPPPPAMSSNPGCQRRSRRCTRARHRTPGRWKPTAERLFGSPSRPPSAIPTRPCSQPP